MEFRKKVIKDLIKTNIVYLFGVGMGCNWKAKTILGGFIGVLIVMLIAATIDYLIIVFKKENE